MLADDPSPPRAAIVFRAARSIQTNKGSEIGLMHLRNVVLLGGAMVVAAACAGSRAGNAGPSPAPTSTSARRPTTTLSTGDVAQLAGHGIPRDTTPRNRPAADSARMADTVPVTKTDVDRSVTSLFGARDSAVHPTPVADSAIEPAWDIEVHAYEARARVGRYVRLFSGPAKESIQLQLERGTRYEPLIRAKMREGGLPEDMYYLGLVESGWDPNAYSKAAAVGMWQFMTTTARDMGMRVDWWVDERRDPVRSTTAAVRFIKDLKEQFGSLYLAAAAYDGGPGRIARGLSRYADAFEGTTGDDLFFALADKNYLRAETREYVPQLIAAALVGKDPERYGLTIRPQPAFAYDSVRVGPSTPLAAIAAASCTNVAMIKDLNPQILRGMTPPKDSLRVRIPRGTADSFAVTLAALPSAAHTAYKTVESKKGQSVASVANKNGLTAQQLAMFNPKIKRLKSGNLVPGQVVLVPTAAVAAAATNAPDPAIEHYGSSRTRVLHVVKSGETLGSLAKKYHTSTSALMKMNGLKRAIVFPGQSIVVGTRRGRK
jgi:membrane-bound lytic murein transglycosylase D